MSAYLAYTKRRYPLHFWRSRDGVEVDFLCETAVGFTAIEAKIAPRWDQRFCRGLNRIREELGRDRVAGYGVYLGEREASWDGTRVLPVADFLRRLWEGQILP
jgi:predicted AAA+ superfamily ATPase